MFGGFSFLVVGVGIAAIVVVLVVVAGVAVEDDGAVAINRWCRLLFFCCS